AYDWPGNIRQLENTVYRAIVLSDGAFLETQDFPQIVAQSSGRQEALRLVEQTPAPHVPVHIDAAAARPRIEVIQPTAPDRFLDEHGEVQALADIERAAIEFAIAHHGGRM